MFEYLESTVTDIINELNKCGNQMEKDAQDYEDRAKKKERQAEKNISDAQDLESASYLEEVPYQDEDGTTQYKTEENTAKKNAAMKKAADLKAEAIKLRINAGILRGLASIIRNGKLDILSKAKLFDNAVESVNRAISNTNTLLSKGASDVSLIISKFYGGNAKTNENWINGIGNNLLKLVGIDLSDGLNDEIYAAIGIATEFGSTVGANLVRMGVSYVCYQLGNDWLSNIAKQGLKIASETLINSVFNDTGAKKAQNAIASALTLHGINALPTKEELNNKENKETLNDDDILAKLKKAQDSYAEYESEIKQLNNNISDNQKTIEKLSEQRSKLIEAKETGIVTEEYKDEVNRLIEQETQVIKELEMIIKKDQAKIEKIKLTKADVFDIINKYGLL